MQSQKKGPMKDTLGIFTYLHLQSLCSDLLQELSNSFKIHSDNTKAHCIHAIYVFIILLKKSPFFYLLKFKVTFVAMILQLSNPRDKDRCVYKLSLITKT